MNFPDTSRAQYCWALPNSYLCAADRLLENPTPQILVPALFLLAHALELLFKAFLMARGLSDKKLRSRDIGHDLVGSFRESKNRGLAKFLSLTKQQVYQIIRVNRYYREKQLEYSEPLAKSFGSINEFHEIVKKVSKAVLDPITEDDFRASTDNAI